MYRHAQLQAYNFAVHTHSLDLNLDAHAERMRRQKALESYNYLIRKDTQFDRFAGRLAVRLMEPEAAGAHYLAINISSGVAEHDDAIDQLLFRRLDQMGIARRSLPGPEVSPTLPLNLGIDFRLVAGMMREGTGALANIVKRDIPKGLLGMHQAAHIATIMDGHLPHPFRRSEFVKENNRLLCRFAEQPDLVAPVLNTYAKLQAGQGPMSFRRAHLQAALDDQLRS
jgi:hypothetical protein